MKPNNRCVWLECPMGTVALADQDDIETLAPRLRKADVVEIEIGWGMNPHGALTMSLGISDLAWTIRNNSGDILGMFGVAPSDIPYVGSPWLLATDGLAEVKLPFLRNCKSFIDTMQKLYPILENYVHIENTMSQAWLKWCGFELGTPQVWGVHYGMFLRAVRLCAPR